MKVIYKKNILLYLGKFPGYGFDIDGGSILARQLIDTLKKVCNLDVVFIRKNHEDFKDNEVHEIRYIEYKDAFNDKFTRRLENLDTNVKAIGNYAKYDTIITAHVSKFFGFENFDDSFWSKTVLFPMFCTSSYIRAGEIVPKEYTEHERFVFSHANKIICPSSVEKLDIVKDYQIDGNKVEVIPRGINPAFHFTNRYQASRNPNIVCIGSIKKQKNNLDALRIFTQIRLNGISAELHFICTIQDEMLYNNMLHYIEIHKMEKYVHFHFELSQHEVAELLKRMDINISVSNWETFGRGIFEGISSGIPTFVYSHLKGIKNICDGCEGVSFAADADDMVQNIISSLVDREQYKKMSLSLRTIANKVSYVKERNKLLKAIL